MGKKEVEKNYHGNKITHKRKKSNIAPKRWSESRTLIIFFFLVFFFFFFLKIKANWADIHETWSSSLKVQKGDVTILRARQLRVQRRGGFLGKIWLLCSDSVKPYWTSILRHSTNASNSAFASPIPKLVLLLLPLLTNGNIIHLRSQTKNLDMMPNHTLSLSSHSIAKFCLSFKNMNIIFLLGSHQKNRNYSRYYRRRDLTQEIGHTKRMKELKQLKE